MRHEPTDKRAVAFVDGQNLFFAAKEAFGYTYPNYDARALALKVCERRGWQLCQTRFYTGVPDPSDNAFWHSFWSSKLAAMRVRGASVFSRPLRYRNKAIRLPSGQTTTALVGHEKGIDIRMALDVVGLALDGRYDVALIFSQDQDLVEVAEEIRMISRRQDRWIKIASAFPLSPTSRNTRGIYKTDWIRIDRATYDACLDPNDYRPKRRPTGEQ
ncbi:MAG: NYN domain-containing protein [Planctomycetota bacterium]